MKLSRLLVLGVALVTGVSIFVIFTGKSQSSDSAINSQSAFWDNETTTKKRENWDIKEALQWIEADKIALISAKYDIPEEKVLNLVNEWFSQTRILKRFENKDNLKSTLEAISLREKIDKKNLAELLLDFGNPLDSVSPGPSSTE